MSRIPVPANSRPALLGLVLLILANPSSLAQDVAPGSGSAAPTSPPAATPVPQAVGADADPDEATVAEFPDEALPPLELDEQQQVFMDAFEQQREALADAISEMRAIYIRYMNDIDRSPEAVARYREARDKVRQQMNATYDAALAMIARAPVVEAASFVVTWIQHCEANDIYDRDTFEGAARLLDGGVRYLFLFAAAGRSAVVSGEFETAKRILEAIEEEKRDKADRALMAQLEPLQANWEREQEFLAIDAENENLPRVLLKTTRGDAVLELFLDQAPNTVAHFVSLVDEGFYDGLDFYQVSSHLLALTGDPLGDGSGHADRYLPDEVSDRPPMRGSLVMAKLPTAVAGQFVPDSASSQFAILFLPLVDSRGQTVFGRVIEGMDVISSLRRVDPTEEKKPNEVLVPPDRILSAEVIRRPAELPEPVYVTPD